MPPKSRKSFCRICQAYCAIEVQVDAGRVIAVRGDRHDAMTGGYTCLKGRQLPEQMNDPERLRSSLKRLPDGSFERIASEQAMDEIAARLQAIIGTHGPRAIASYCGTAAYFNSGTVPVVKGWHKGLGSPSFYTSLTIDQTAKMMALARHGLWAGGTHSFSSADVVLVVGNNPLVSQLAPPSGVSPFNPFKRLNDAKKRGLRLICIDPRRSELARRADIHLQVRPGEDPCLLAGILRVILQEQRHDAAFCAKHVEGLDAFRDVIDDFTPEFVEARSGVPAQQMIAAARLFAAGPRGCASSGTGPDMAPHPNLAEHLITCLNSLCGRYNREGERIDNVGVLGPALPRTAQAIPPELLPPHLNYREGPKSRLRGLQQIFEEMPTSVLSDEILEAGDGQVRALFSVGGNPVTAWPDQHRTLRALDALELLVCVDAKLTATVRHADYVIAPKLPLEREDVTLFSDMFYELPYAHYTPPVVEPDSDLIEDWELYLGLARRMKISIELPGRALDPAQPLSKFALLEALTPGSRIPLARVRAQAGGHVFEELEVRVAPAIPEIRARLRLLPEGIAAELRVVRAEPMRAPGRYGQDGSYTHLLICRRLRHVMNSMGHDLSQAPGRGTTNAAFMNCTDVERMGLSAGDLVEIASEHDSILGVVEPTDELQPGVISMAHGWEDAPKRADHVRNLGSNTSRLVSVERNVDPLTGMTRQTAIPVKIRPAAPSVS